MSDGDSDSSSSDIGRMLQKVQQQKKNKRNSEELEIDSGSSSKSSEDDDQEDSDDDAGNDNDSSDVVIVEERYASIPPRHNKKKKSIESALAALEQKQAMAKQMRERRLKDDDSDSDNDSDHQRNVQHGKKHDKNAISIVMESFIEGEEPKDVIAVDDDGGNSSSSDDDDDGVDVANNKGAADLPETALLKELAKAAATLQSVQQQSPAVASPNPHNGVVTRSNAANHVEEVRQLHQALPSNFIGSTLKDMSGSTSSTEVAQQPQGKSMIQVLVVAEKVCPGASSSQDDTASNTQSIALQIHIRDPLSKLVNKILKELGLSSDEAVVTLTSSQQQALHPKHTAELYQLTSGCTIHAKVHLMGLDNAGKNSKDHRAEKKENLGKSLHLLLRRSNGEQISIKTYQRETFQSVMDKVCQQQPAISRSSIKLNFDGELLTANQTPQSLDMENDDLIDVME